MKIFKYVLLFGIGLVCIAPQSFAVDVGQKEIAALQQKADQGDMNAQFLIGVLYRRGDGVPHDYAKAMEWYQKAAAQGHPYAQNNIGVMYEHGLGVAKDKEKAKQYYKQACLNHSLESCKAYQDLSQ